MIKTKTKSRKQIVDLAIDLEVINPIESKTVLGGDWYNGWDSWGYDDSGMTFTYGGSDNGGWYDPFGGAVDYSDDSYSNANQDWDYGGGGTYTSIPQNCALNGLPTNVPQQIGNMCTFESFTFAANLLGSHATLDSISLSLAQNPNIGLAGVQNGLTTLQLSIGINNLFENTRATTIDQIQTALCNNQPTLAFMSGHEITIVGYNSVNATFTVADTQWTTDHGYHDIPEGAIDMSNAYIITGVRPL